MNRYRTVIAVVVALIVVAGAACNKQPSEIQTPSPDSVKTVDLEKKKTRFVVIVPPVEGTDQCQIVPFAREMDQGVKWVTFVNLADSRVKVEIPGTLTDTTGPVLTFELDMDEWKEVRLKTVQSGDYIYSMEGPTGGCLTGLPNPHIIIP